ncbi:phage shock protein A [Paenibacillus sp. J31TS4]|uniref:PspA/IM30 family protein n=1 Tax=Paenibacillus sp. J31TS4 TaxID=2807195 RepID=UPI001B1BB40E|nr:PspA/IM30 family protein [Paenibacillus sp. J31TS4]GIP40876.1 phage shock protein A [Paenibacillus sp. J31TS4]
MSILKRMRDITVATIHDRLEQSEDPVRLIDQYLSAQREEIKQSEQLYAQCLQHSESMKRQFLQADELRRKREEQALLALKAGEDDVARLALQEKIMHEEKADAYRELYEQSRLPLSELAEQLNRLKADYQEVASKRSYYQARMESVRLQQKLNERMTGTPGRPVGRMFDRLEERVSDMEGLNRSLREVRTMTKEVLYQAGTTVQKALDQELEQLKKKLEQEGWAKR